IAHVLSLDERFTSAAKETANALFPKRGSLEPRALAELAFTLARAGEKENAAVALRNLENTARIDEVGGTVHWEPGGSRCRWNGSDVQTTAAALQAYLSVEPEGRMARMTRNWLIGNRRGNAWASTLETATVLYVLADYARANNETSPDCTVSVALESG